MPPKASVEKESGLTGYSVVPGLHSCGEFGSGMKMHPVGPPDQIRTNIYICAFGLWRAFEIRYSY